jgi:hypothetical protein
MLLTIRVQTVAAIVGASFGALVGRLSAFLSMRKDVAATRRDIARGTAAAAAIKTHKTRAAQSGREHPPIARSSPERNVWVQTAER